MPSVAGTARAPIDRSNHTQKYTWDTVPPYHLLVAQIHARINRVLVTLNKPYYCLLYRLSIWDLHLALVEPLV